MAAKFHYIDKQVRTLSPLRGSVYCRAVCGIVLSPLELRFSVLSKTLLSEYPSKVLRSYSTDKRIQTLVEVCYKFSLKPSLSCFFKNFFKPP